MIHCSFIIAHLSSFICHRSYIIARLSGIVVAGGALPCGGIARLPNAPAMHWRVINLTHSRRKAVLHLPIVDIPNKG
jgi:hypothetical protein